MLTLFKEKLKKTSTHMFGGLFGLLSSSNVISEDFLKELEMRLLLADVGVETTQQLLQQITTQIKKKPNLSLSELRIILVDQFIKVLQPFVNHLVLSEQAKPYVVLIVGVNGSGKTTTIAKLAHFLKKQGKNIVFAAGDTFRAAAIEQLQVWGKRLDIPVIAQQPGADSAAVIYDAVQAAKARGCDIVLADTAGRLHTQGHLMEELKKVRRVLAKIDTNYPHEVMLVLDASIGQNALAQAKQFKEAVGITGITITKLDGTAKGGIIFSITRTLGLPVNFVGVGEGIDDLYEFDPVEFVEGLCGWK